MVFSFSLGSKRVICFRAHQKMGLTRGPGLAGCICIYSASALSRISLAFYSRFLKVSAAASQPRAGHSRVPASGAHGACVATTGRC